METGCVALCFITIYCSYYFNVYGARRRCELSSGASLRSESLQGAGPGVTLIHFWLPPYFIKNTILLSSKDFSGYGPVSTQSR